MEFLQLYVQSLSKHKQLLEKLKQECIRIRNYTIEKLFDLWNEAKDNLENLGIEVVLVKDKDEFWKIFPKYIEGVGKIAKTKTNVGKELELTKKLRNLGYTVCETDCGDFIVEVLGEESSHPMIPALHLDTEKIASGLKERLGINVAPTPEAIKEAVRQHVKRFLQDCEVGITGANFVSADGSIFLQENEGNISLVSRLKKHIVVTSLEKIVPDRQAALRLCELQALACSAQPLGSYLSVISGPSQTGDIGGRLLRGMYGAEEVVVIVVDNGRSKLLDSQYREVLRCISCGACVAVCPLCAAGKVQGLELKGLRGVLFQRYQHRLEELAPCIFSCSLCGACEQVCPMNIPWTKFIRLLRQECAAAGLLPEQLKQMAEKMKRYMNPIGEAKPGKDLQFFCC